MDPKVSIHRIRNCVFDLLSMEDLFVDYEDSWDLLGRYLHLKSTLLYCNFYQAISGAHDDDRKRTLTDLANRLSHYMGELGNAVKDRNISTTQDCYNDVALVLLEVMVALLPLH